MRPRAQVFALMFATVIFAAVAGGGTALAQAPTVITFTGYVPLGGTSMVVMDQSGSPEDVVRSLRLSGCFAKTIAIAQRGAFVVYVAGAPDFANVAFPTFLSPGTPIAIRCLPVPTTAAATEVTHFVPERPAESTAQDGSCFSSSLALGGRGDTWRCTVDNAISDPCFALADGALVCGADPTTGETGFLLNLTEPLPASDVTPAAVASAARNGWLLELRDGTFCGLNTGATGGINGERANYGCVGGEWIFGDLTPGTVWTGVLGSMTISEAGYRLGAAREAVIAHVWQ